MKSTPSSAVDSHPGCPSVFTEKKLDFLLCDIIRQAQALAIPVSKHICPNILLNNRAKARFGCCRKQGQRYTIELSHRLCTASEAACRTVLAHEVLHTCPGCHNHGAQWRAYAMQMNRTFGYCIARTTTPGSLGLQDSPIPRYVLVCSACKSEIHRFRASKFTRNPSLYRCRCGGQFRYK